MTEVTGTLNYLRKANRRLALANILFVLSLTFSLSAVLLHYSSHAQKSVVSPKKPFSLNQVIRQGEVELRVSDIRYSAGAPPFIAPEGKEYALLTLEVKNVSNRTVSILPANDTYLKCGEGQIYYLSPTLIDTPFRAGDLLPGDSVKGDLSYLVDKNRSLKLYIDALWSGGVLPVSVR